MPFASETSSSSSPERTNVVLLIKVFREGNRQRSAVEMKLSMLLPWAALCKPTVEEFRKTPSNKEGQFDWNGVYS